MRTHTNTSVALMTAVLTVGLCVASALAAVSVIPARAPSSRDDPVSAPAHSVAIERISDPTPLTDSEWAVLDLGGSMVTDLSASRVYFQ